MRRSNRTAMLSNALSQSLTLFTIALVFWCSTLKRVPCLSMRSIIRGIGLRSLLGGGGVDVVVRAYGNALLRQHHL